MRKEGRVKLKYFFSILMVSFVMIMMGCVSTDSVGSKSASEDSRVLKPHADIRGGLGWNKVDLNEYDLRGSDLTKTIFDSFTEWPEKSKLPEGFDPGILMEYGRNPGLGIADLHKQNITGKNINVAIIDQPLLLDHIEYAGKIKSYTKINTGYAAPQMHGPAVTSILCGNTCGVAPDVNVYYWAEPSWKGDHKYRTQALDEIIKFNEGKSLADQIRIVSVSKGYDTSEPNLDKWIEKIDEAEKAGIYVIHCSRNMFGAKPPLSNNRDNPDDYEVCYLVDRYSLDPSNHLFAPIDNRTYAHWKGTEAYTFGSLGGFSWGAPYIAGVAALGLQVDPNLTVSEIERLLMESGTPFHGGKLINPVRFIEMIKAR